MHKIPIKLKKDPIVEAIFELRFQVAAQAPSALADVLAGVLYADFKPEFPQFDRLPFHDVPEQLVAVDPNLRYQPRNRLRGDRAAITIGDRVAGVSCPRPYIGWEHFFPLIKQVVEKIRKADVIGVIERFSVKYINVLEAKDLSAQYSLVDVKAHVGRYDLKDRLFHVRTELEESGLTNIIELRSGTTVTTIDRKQFKGVLLTIDTLNKNPDDFWRNADQLINAAHNMEKQMFYNCLSERGLEQCEPVWN